MFFPTLQIMVIIGIVCLVIGIIIGWKLTFNLRLAKITELENSLNKEKAKRDNLSEKLRKIQYANAKENVETFVSDTADSAKGFVSGIRNKIFGGKQKDEPEALKEPDKNNEV